MAQIKQNKMLKFQGIDKSGPKVQLGTKVVIPAQVGQPTELIGEVAALSVTIPNFILAVTVTFADGRVTTIEVQNLIVKAHAVWRSAPNIFKAVGNFFTDLFKRKK
jgi:hypothetical protein